MLSHVGSLLPAYKDVLNLLRGSHKVSDRLCISLRNFYLDLLEFFGSVARVFTQKSGSTLTSHEFHPTLLKCARIKENACRHRAANVATFRRPICKLH